MRSHEQKQQLVPGLNVNGCRQFQQEVKTGYLHSVQNKGTFGLSRLYSKSCPHSGLGHFTNRIIKPSFQNLQIDSIKLGAAA